MASVSGYGAEVWQRGCVSDWSFGPDCPGSSMQSSESGSLSVPWAPRFQSEDSDTYLFL